MENNTFCRYKRNDVKVWACVRKAIVSASNMSAMFIHPLSHKIVYNSSVNSATIQCHDSQTIESSAFANSHSTIAVDKCFEWNGKIREWKEKLTLNWLECSNLWKSGSNSRASSRFCRNCRWNVTISWILPNKAWISAFERNVSRFNGSK